MDDEFGDDADFAAIANSFDRPAQASSNANSAKVQQPKPQALPGRSGPSAVIVSTRQKGNPSLNYIRNVPWEYGDIPADYVLGATTCALFLSLKYHRLHPEYIYSRIRSLGQKYNLRIMLTMVDIQNHEESLKELSKTSLINNLTLMLCWSAQEAGRYLELYKSYEHASPTSIRAHQATSYSEKLVEFVTVPRSVNKTDAVSIVSAFGSIRAAINARPEEIGEITGWGEKKVQRWCGTVREPFRVKKAARKRAGLAHEESSISLHREDSSRSQARDGSLFGEEHGIAHEGSAAGIVLRATQEAIPVGKVSTREAHIPKIGKAAANPDRASKRSAEEATMMEPNMDEEEALLAAATAKGAEISGLAKNGAPDESKTRAPAKDDEALDSGIAAALAKLRES